MLRPGRRVQAPAIFGAVVGGGGGNTMTLDGGSTVAETTSISNVALTTTGTTGLIVLGALVSGSHSVSTVTATGLTFTKELGITLSNLDNMEVWTAPYTSNFSGNISVDLGSSHYHIFSVIGIKGAKTSLFDDTGSPASSTTGATSLTTANANDAVVAWIETSGVAASAGSGWTASPGSLATNFAFMEYQLPSATGTFTASMSAGTITGSIILGIKQGP